MQQKTNRLLKNLAAFIGLPLITLSLSTHLFALVLPSASATPGGIVHLPITDYGTSVSNANSSTYNNTAKQASAPKVIYRGNPVMVVPAEGTQYQDQAAWLAIIGIPLSANAGTQRVTVDGKTVEFELNDKQYKEQRITIKNKRKVNPEQRDMERITREKKEILNALASWSTTDTPVTQLLKPTQGPYSSPFGLRRFFNDQPRNPHSGLDIAGAKGSAIIAPAAGKVVAVGDYFFNGRTVIIDHGLGLTTMYCHMDRIDVKLGDQLQAGAQLGTIGNTGRVTGPHLHWGVSLNNERINPMLIMSKP